MTESINEGIPSLLRGKLRMEGNALVATLAPGILTVDPECLTRQHLGRKVRFQRITGDGHAIITAVLESVQFDGDSYMLALDSDTTVSGSFTDGATVQFL